MDADEVLTGRKRHNDTKEDSLYSFLGKPVSEEVLKEVFEKRPKLPEINPKPYIKVIKTKGEDRKMHHGIEVGLEVSF